MNDRPTTSTHFPYTTLFRSPWWWASFAIAPWRSRPSMSFVMRGFERTRSAWRLKQLQLEGSSKPRMTQLIDGLRSEEHTSELQSRRDLVCRLPPEKNTSFDN